MNITSARSRVERIRKAAEEGNDGKATQLENDLCADALRAIAAGTKDARTMAKTVVASFDIAFERMPEEP